MILHLKLMFEQGINAAVLKVVLVLLHCLAN